jgi:hypothetical protein
VLLNHFKTSIMNSKTGTMQNKRLVVILLSATFILLIPFTAMQFTGEVNWTQSDFIAAGALLFGTGLVCELVLRNVKQALYRLIAIGVILAAFFLTWLELAVGIFGTPLAGS